MFLSYILHLHLSLWIIFLLSLNYGNDSGSLRRLEIAAKMLALQASSPMNWIFSFPQTFTNFLSTQQKHRKYLYIFNKYILIYFTGITDRSFSWRIFIGTIYEFFGQRQWWKEGRRHRLFKNVFQGRQMLWLYFSHATKDVPQFKQNSTG